MVLRVKTYRIVWSDKGEQYGAVDLYDDAGNTARLRTENPFILSFWTETLRNEKPVSFNTESGILYTGREPLGEEES